MYPVGEAKLRFFSRCTRETFPREKGMLYHRMSSVVHPGRVAASLLVLAPYPVFRRRQVPFLAHLPFESTLWAVRRLGPLE